MNQKSVQPPQQKKRWWAKNVVRIPLICLTICGGRSRLPLHLVVLLHLVLVPGTPAHLEWPAWRSQHEAPRGERRKQCYPRLN